MNENRAFLNTYKDHSNDNVRIALIENMWDEQLLVAKFKAEGFEFGVLE